MITVSDLEIQFGEENFVPGCEFEVYTGELLWSNRCQWCREIYVLENIEWRFGANARNRDVRTGRTVVGIETGPLCL